MADGRGSGVMDIWASEDEIRKSAHRFMENGGLVTKLHEGMEGFGTIVENAVAQTDFTQGGDTVKKGSWYVAIKPTPEGREAINKGEFEGVSIEGEGTRTLEKSGDETEPTEGFLKKIADYFGISPKAEGDEPSTLHNQEPKEESEMNEEDRKRLETLEKSTEATNTAVKALAGSFEKLVERIDQRAQKRDEEETTSKKDESTPEAVKKSVDELGEQWAEFAGKLDKIEKQVEGLSQGQSSQGSQESDTVKKGSEDPLASLLD
jgi:hypothetical protein